MEMKSETDGSARGECRKVLPSDGHVYGVLTFDGTGVLFISWDGFSGGVQHFHHQATIAYVCVDIELVMLAQEAANSVPACLEIAKTVRETAILRWDVTGHVEPQRWHRLYRRPGAVWSAMWNAATAPDGGPTDAMEKEFRRSRFAAMSALRDDVERKLTGKVTEREQRIHSRLVERYYQRTHLPSIARIASGEEEPMPASAADWLGNAEFLFFMGIVVPCLLEYQVMPFTLYQSATRGHLESLEKLLRLDPHINRLPSRVRVRRTIARRRTATRRRLGNG